MSTLNQRLEDILIFLKVIAKLEVGQRLLFKPNSVSIRNNYMVVTPVVRWLASESRKDVTVGLTELVDDINHLVTDYINSPELQIPNMTDYDRDKALTILMALNRLKVDVPPLIENSQKGLYAAKETYISDSETSAKIDGIIENLKSTVRKINIAINQVNQKLNLDVKINHTDLSNFSGNEKKYEIDKCERRERDRNKVKINQMDLFNFPNNEKKYESDKAERRDRDIGRVKKDPVNKLDHPNKEDKNTLIKEEEKCMIKDKNMESEDESEINKVIVD